jgi:hypothetical protein
MKMRVEVDPALTHSPHISMRLAWQDGQKPRVLQENVSRCSARQAGQWILILKTDPLFLALLINGPAAGGEKR